ncbi:MAG: PD-(D/E)XK motif protein [Pseudomonas sp.]|jgi:hypothetical protein|nr:PD-(D/E)XK motif protein [Pseudomonas sp.]
MSENLNKSRHITWEQLKERIQVGIPFIHRIPPIDGKGPALDILVSEFGTELSLRVPCRNTDKPELSKLEELDIRKIITDSGPMLEVQTGARILYQEIYGFFVSVADKVQLDKKEALEAIEETLEGWRELIKTQAILSEEAQLGLRGELYFLRSLLRFFGSDALTAWVGPQRQPHDFRIGRLEFEVKTTRGTSHTHIINGLSQLEASLNHSLFIFSMRLSPAGVNAGTTLSEEIEKTHDSLDRKGKIQLDRILRTHFNYRSEHSSYYKLRLKLADTPLVVPVDTACPRLTNDLLSSIPLRSRIYNVSYFANLDGLGYAENSENFSTLMLSAIPSHHQIPNESNQ